MPTQITLPQIIDTINSAQAKLNMKLLEVMSAYNDLNQVVELSKQTLHMIVQQMHQQPPVSDVVSEVK